VSSYASVAQSGGGGDGFQQAGCNWRRHKPPKVIRGRNDDAGDLTTSERRVHFCVSGVAPSGLDGATSNDSSNVTEQHAK